MRVFRACMLIIKRRAASLALYFGIFLILAIVMPILSFDQYSTDFSEIRLNYSIINRDGDTPLSAGLDEFLSRRGNAVTLDDRKDALQDAAFYHATDYIAILPEGFNEAFRTGAPLSIETVVTTETAKGYYADSLVNQYFNQARMYLEAGVYDEEALISAILQDLSAEATVVIKQYGAGAPVDEVYQVFSRLSCYIIVVLIILCISNITSSFRRPDIRMRNLCSPLKPRSMAGQQIMCGALISLAAWALIMILGFVLYGAKLAGTDSRSILLITLNSFVVTVVALSLASLTGPLINSPNSQNAVANFVSLSLCFLGGVFVPLDLMGSGILTVARFTPLYWYSEALDRISSLNTYSREALAPVWQAMLTQLAFAAAFFCVALVISKQLNQSERSFGSIQTQLEA